MGMAAARKQEVSLTTVLVKKKWAGSQGLMLGGEGGGYLYVLPAGCGPPSTAPLQSPSLPIFSLSTDCNKKYSSEESLVAVLSVYPQLHCAL